MFAASSTRSRIGAFTSASNVNVLSASCASNEPVKKNVNRACTRGESGEFALTAALNQDSRAQVQSSVQAIVKAPSVRFGLLGLQSDPTRLIARKHSVRLHSAACRHPWFHDSHPNNAARP